MTDLGPDADAYAHRDQSDRRIVIAQEYGDGQSKDRRLLVGKFF
jgi:hypothetical protein